MTSESAATRRITESTDGAGGWAIAFLAVELAILVAILTQVHAEVLPKGVATQVGHNSEAFALALLLSTTIVAVRMISRDTERPMVLWGAVVVGVVAFSVLGVVLLGLSNPRLKTLNEPAFAGAALLAYCAIPRRPRLLAATSVFVLILTVAFFSTSVVLAAEDFVIYAARGNEAFWGLFLVHVLGIVAWGTVRSQDPSRSARVSKQGTALSSAPGPQNLAWSSDWVWHSVICISPSQEHL